MPKLDPDDVDQPTATDVAAAAQANAVNPATTTAAPATATAGKAAPSFFGGNNATTPTSGAATFGAPASGGFGSPGTSFGSTQSTGGFGSSSGFGGGTFGTTGGQPQQQIAADANTTAAFSNLMAASAGQEPEHWMKSFWRPAMGWLYMLICFMDFVAFPMISMFLPIIEKSFGMQMGYTAWQSLTLSNGGLIHLAFGGILGVSAYGRTKEKTAGT